MDITTRIETQQINADIMNNIIYVTLVRPVEQIKATIENNSIVSKIETQVIVAKFLTQQWPPWPEWWTVLLDSTYTYNTGNLEVIDYEDGTSKTLTYDVQWQLTTIVRDRLTTIITKTFAYNAQGDLISVDIS